MGGGGGGVGGYGGRGQRGMMGRGQEVTTTKTKGGDGSEREKMTKEEKLKNGQ